MRWWQWSAAVSASLSSAPAAPAIPSAGNRTSSTGPGFVIVAGFAPRTCRKLYSRDSRTAAETCLSTLPGCSPWRQLLSLPETTKKKKMLLLAARGLRRCDEQQQ